MWNGCGHCGCPFALIAGSFAAIIVMERSLASWPTVDHDVCASVGNGCTTSAPLRGAKVPRLDNLELKPALSRERRPELLLRSSASDKAHSASFHKTAPWSVFHPLCDGQRARLGLGPWQVCAAPPMERPSSLASVCRAHCAATCHSFLEAPRFCSPCTALSAD